MSGCDDIAELQHTSARKRVDEFLEAIEAKRHVIGEHSVQQGNIIASKQEESIRLESDCILRQSLLRDLQTQCDALRAQVNDKDTHLKRLSNDENELKSQSERLRREREQVAGSLSDILVDLGLDSNIFDNIFTQDPVEVALQICANREHELRTYEDQLLDLAARVSHREAELQKLAAEAMESARELSTEQQELASEVEIEQAELDRLVEELRIQESKREKPREKLFEIEELRKNMHDVYQDLSREKDKISTQLETEKETQRKVEMELQTKLQELNRTGNVAEIRFRLDEAMMLLKASVINLHGDYDLIGGVRQEVKKMDQVQREAAFTTAYDCVRMNIADIYGPVFSSTSTDYRWSLNSTVIPSTTPRATVESLVMNMKKMVIAYDMLPMRCKYELKESLHVIQNAFTLYSIARQSTQKLRDYDFTGREKRTRAASTTTAKTNTNNRRRSLSKGMTGSSSSSNTSNGSQPPIPNPPPHPISQFAQEYLQKETKVHVRDPKDNNTTSTTTSTSGSYTSNKRGSFSAAHQQQQLQQQLHTPHRSITPVEQAQQHTSTGNSSLLINNQTSSVDGVPSVPTLHEVQPRPPGVPDEQPSSNQGPQHSKPTTSPPLSPKMHHSSPPSPTIAQDNTTEYVRHSSSPPQQQPQFQPQQPQQLQQQQQQVQQQQPQQPQQQPQQPQQQREAATNERSISPSYSRYTDMATSPIRNPYTGSSPTRQISVLPSLSGPNCTSGGNKQSGAPMAVGDRGNAPQLSVSSRGSTVTPEPACEPQPQPQIHSRYPQQKSSMESVREYGCGTPTYLGSNSRPASPTFDSERATTPTFESRSTTPALAEPDARFTSTRSGSRESHLYYSGTEDGTERRSTTPLPAVDKDTQIKVGIAAATTTSSHFSPPKSTTHVLVKSDNSPTGEIALPILPLSAMASSYSDDDSARTPSPGAYHFTPGSITSSATDSSSYISYSATSASFATSGTLPAPSSVTSSSMQAATSMQQQYISEKISSSGNITPPPGATTYTSAAGPQYPPGTTVTTVVHPTKPLTSYTPRSRSASPVPPVPPYSSSRSASTEPPPPGSRVAGKASTTTVGSRRPVYHHD